MLFMQINFSPLVSVENSSTGDEEGIVQTNLKCKRITKRVIISSLHTNSIIFHVLILVFKIHPKSNIQNSHFLNLMLIVVVK